MTIRRLTKSHFLTAVIGAITLLSVVAGAVQSYLLFSPSANSAVEAAKAVDDPSLDRELIKLLDCRGIIVQLDQQERNYYDFSVTSKDGGGVEVAAARGVEGKLEILWQGQDATPCAIIESRDVPFGIAPYCLKTITLDRTNVLRSLYITVF